MKTILTFDLGGSSLTRTQVFPGRSGTPVYPAILWPDYREGKFRAGRCGRP